MVTVCVTLNEQSVLSIDEIAKAIGKIDGEKPSKSRVIRMALAELFKKLSNEGHIAGSGKKAAK